MVKKHPIQHIVDAQKRGVAIGIVSVCSSNRFVIEATLRRANMINDYALIEATANQVDQYGGYTGMKPSDFIKFVQEIAQSVNFPLDRLILGGDHLGPLTRRHLNESEAMAHAEQLISAYVKAGFTKIHVDTSMKLADDPEGVLAEQTVARRGAYLVSVAEKAYKVLLQRQPEAIPPVYVIGSEVPIPGGAIEEETLAVTTPDQCHSTIQAFIEAFNQYGVSDVWQRVVGLVVQPGVEFMDTSIHEYNREHAKELCQTLHDYQHLVFEGHSTDYQRPELLKQMVEDGIAILKVGPGLTFALRETLFALEEIERAMQCEPLSNFKSELDHAMLKNDKNWSNHYHGDEKTLSFKRKYSFSDRARYYLGDQNVEAALVVLLDNLSSVDIPLSLVSQYLSQHYSKVRNGILKPKAYDFLMAGIWQVLDGYFYAITPSAVAKVIYDNRG